MAFDLSTARPYKPKGFDISTARPVGAPRSPPETRPRSEVEAELAQRQAASAEADRTNSAMNVIEPVVRGGLQAATGLAKGVAGLPAMVEEGADALLSLPLGGQRVVPRVFRGSMDALSPEELAPRNTVERFNTTGSELLGGALTGVGAGEKLAEAAVSPVTRAVGRAVADMPGRQAIGAATGAASGTAAHEMGFGPTGELVATILGGAAPFVGAKPTPGLFDPPPAGAGPGSTGIDVPSDAKIPRPFGPEVRLAREMGVPLTPDAVAAQSLRYGGGSPPGKFRASLAGPEGDFSIRAGAANRITDLALQDIGLAPGVKFTPEVLESVRGPANAVFDRVAREVPVLTPDSELQQAVSALGADMRNNPLLEASPAIEKLRERLASTPTVETQYVLDAIRQWRRSARTLFQSTDDPAKHEMAGAYRAAADAFETAIERQAAASGNPQLVQDLRGARTLLAKVHNIDDSLVGTELDAAKLAKIGERVPLSGALADIATIGTNFGESVRPVVGAQYPTPTLTQALINHSYLARRLGGERLIPGLLKDKFQNRFGEANPGYAPWDQRPDFAAPPPPPPAPDAPPPGGRFPWSPAGEGPLDLAPEGGGIPFSETPLPPVGGEGLALADSLPPELFAGVDTRAAGDLALPGPLDEFLGSGVGPGELPFRATQTDAPGLQPGRSVSMSDPLMPEPGPFGPDVSPAPRGPNDAGPFNPTGSPRAGGPDTAPGSLGLAPENAHELPNSIADLLTSPQAASLVDRFLGGYAPEGGAQNPLQAIMDALGTGGEPPVPMGPPRGPRGLADVRSGLDATAEPTGAARPDDFGDLLPPEAMGAPVKPPRPPKGPPRDTGDELTLEEGAGRGELPTDFNAIEETLSEGAIKLGDNRRSIVLKPFNGRLRIQQTDVAPKWQGFGLGQENIMEAARHAAKEGMALDSDVSFTPSAWRAWKALLAKGRVLTDEVPTAAIEAAFERDPSVARNPSGEPWIKNIRLNPEG